MHHFIVIKAYADSVSNAKDIVESIASESIENSEAGYDYVGSIEHITLKKLPNMGYNVQTFKEFEAVLERNRRDNLTGYKTFIYNILFDELAPTLLSKDEAILMAGETMSEKTLSIIETILKNKNHKVPDTSFKNTLTLIMNSLEKLSIEGDSIFTWLRSMERLGDCIQYPYDNGYNLQCSDNTIAIANDSSEGRRAYYFSVDRHL